MSHSVPYFIARISEDKDFFKLKELAENHEGWNLEYDKNMTRVYTRHVEDCNFNMVKVCAFFSSVNCLDLYDTIQDPEYRREWDSHMIVGIEIGYLNPNNDVSYYAMRCPAPLKNRDLVLQKSWLDAGTEFYIINHSVCHKDYPPKKGFVRAISFFTGYLIKCQPLSRGMKGCELSYVTRSDPQGVLPAWLVNRVTQILAPRYIRQIEKAAIQYNNWKSSNNPNYKPWVHPEQINAPRISVKDCIPSEEELLLSPHLRQYDSSWWSPQATSTVDNKNAVKAPATTRTMAEPTESSSGGGHISKSNAVYRGDRRKTKRLNSLLNFTKICRKKSGEE